MTAFARQLARFVVCLLLCGPTHAASSANTLPGTGERIVRHHTSGIALDGFDPVAYFEKSRAVAGKAEHELQHSGVTWRFASRSNHEAFAANPDAYMPLFGGYDPASVSLGQPVAGSPEHFAMLNGRLALFFTALTRDQFVSTPTVLADALAKWPQVEHQLAR